MLTTIGKVISVVFKYRPQHIYLMKSLANDQMYDLLWRN